MNQSERKTMKRNLLTSALCLALLLMMLLSSTLAWFTDSKANVNVMTAGKIGITQTVVDTQVVVMPTVEINRAITVTNDGNQAAYVRTLIAFEDKVIDNVKTTDVVETMVGYLVLGDSKVVIPGVKDTNSKIQFTAADGTVYTVGYYLHGELAHGESYTCLNSITLGETAPSEWQEAAGEQYQIVVLSQAVQTAGFEPAVGETVAEAAAAALNNSSVFGEVNAENVKTWFGTVVPVNP